MAAVFVGEVKILWTEVAASCTDQKSATVNTLDGESYVHHHQTHEEDAPDGKELQIVLDQSTHSQYMSRLKLVCSPTRSFACPMM